jgi:hypothetical protein
LSAFETVSVAVPAVDDIYTREAVKDLRCDGFLCKTKPTPDLLAWVAHLSAPGGK